MEKFKLVSPFKPFGDQPVAIDKLVSNIKMGIKEQTLLGATGTGKTSTAKIFSRKIAQNVSRLAYALDLQQVDATLELLDCISKLELSVDIAEAQNYFFSKIVTNIEELIMNMTCSADRELITMLFEITYLRESATLETLSLVVNLTEL